MSDKNAAGIEFLFKKNKIDYIRGEATVDKAGAVKVKLTDGKEETHSAPKILDRHRGGVARRCPGFAFNGKTVIGSREAMILEKQPKSMVIIGAGAIGVEFAYFFNAFGTKVTMVEMMPNLLPVEDTEVSQALEKSFAKQGINVLHEHEDDEDRGDRQGVKITVADCERRGEDDRSRRLPRGDRRRRRCCRAALKLRVDRARLHQDQRSLRNERARSLRRRRHHRAAVARARRQLTRRSRPSKACSSKGHKPKKVTVFPGCTYCHPQVASVGLTERAAKEKGLKFKVGKFPFMASGKARAIGEMRRLREADHRRTARRNPRRAHHRSRSHRDDRRARPRDHARSHATRKSKPPSTRTRR